MFWHDNAEVPDGSIDIDANDGVTDNVAMLDKLKRITENKGIIYTNQILAFDNEYGWNDELDCVDIYIRHPDKIFGSWQRIDTLTDRTIRLGDNVGKLYLAGEFMKNDYENYVCADCFNKLNECTCETKPWHLVQIDPMIQDSVRILNEKGYFTRYCCEGHCVGEGMYIKFGISWMLDSVPDGFEYKSKDNIIRHVFTDDADYAKKVLYAEKLLYWAENLPAVSRGNGFH